MNSATEIENKLRQLKPFLSEKFSVERIGLFGSYAEQKQNPESDLDIFVEFSKPIGWNFFTLEKFLEEQFGLKIDLVTRNAIRSQLKEKILKQVHFV
ncbi:MAG: nucleotidyltransferase family protein [Bacteroidia bacterium]|nr:nucleotidyltransferase family protein [Bacteroidia bacterium]